MVRIMSVMKSNKTMYSSRNSTTTSMLQQGFVFSVSNSQVTFVNDLFDAQFLRLLFRVFDSAAIVRVFPEFF